MKATVQGLVLACVVLSLTGCGSLTGHWTMESIKPEASKQHFDLGMLCLCKDGTFLMCSGAGDKCKETTGTYKYAAADKTLTFTFDQGKERVYKAELTEGGKKMKVEGTAKGEDWTAMLKRVEGGCGPADTGTCAKGKGDTKTCPMAKEEPKKAEPKKAEPPKADKKTETPKAEKKTEPKKAKPGNQP
jgi:hypothetical protein